MRGLLVLLAALVVGACGTPAPTQSERHARAAQGCTQALERNGWREVEVVSTEGIGGFEVQVILQQAGGFKKVCRYDAFNDTAFVQLP